MERKIGEQFDYNGVTLEVCGAKAQPSNPCGDCYFLGSDRCFEIITKTGFCSDVFRSDKKDVYFKEVKK